MFHPSTKLKEVRTRNKPTRTWLCKSSGPYADLNGFRREFPRARAPLPNKAAHCPQTLPVPVYFTNIFYTVRNLLSSRMFRGSIFGGNGNWLSRPGGLKAPVGLLKKSIAANHANCANMKTIEKACKRVKNERSCWRCSRSSRPFKGFSAAPLSPFPAGQAVPALAVAAGYEPGGRQGNECV